MDTHKNIPENAPIVLIVDDNIENLKVLGNTLREHSLHVAIAKDGASAFKMIEKHKPDIILLDIIMPDMDGFQICQKLKSEPQNSDIPIIFLTAKNDKEEIVKGFSLGAVDYITKPFYTEELISRISTHLQLQKQKNLLNQKNIELQRLNETKDKLFSIIAHDLKNPFTGLLGLFEVLADRIETLSTEDIREFSSAMLSSLQNLYSLFTELFQWAVLQAGSMEFKPEKLKLSILVKDVIDLMQVNASAKNIALKFDIPDQVCLYADRIMLKSILQNLVFNGIKFTSNGGRVEITHQISEGKVSIKINDNGIGMSKELINDLFLLDKSTKRSGTNGEQGTGFGLILVYEMVKKSGGEITVESIEGVGTSFIITLPLGEES